MCRMGRGKALGGGNWMVARAGLFFQVGEKRTEEGGGGGGGLKVGLPGGGGQAEGLCSDGESGGRLFSCCSRSLLSESECGRRRSRCCRSS